ncbi:MAG: right-handed parallel beta-helix repeat-containing protein, partial [Elusimicrobia bacterium]|nr:right-handed parallel beta-helix repeat-containing protein [Elusimicrobiota bacterium]
VFISSLALSWGANTNPAGTTYRIDYWKVSGATSSVTTSAATGAVTGLDPGTSVYIMIYGLNGSTSASALSSGILYAFTAASGAANFSGLALGVSSIAWSWSDAVGEDRYVIAASSGGAVSASLAEGTTFWTETGLSTNTSYSRRVISIKSNYQNASLAAGRFALAAPPTGLAFIAVKSSQTTVSWSANGNPLGTTYQILHWLPAGSTATLMTNASSLTISGLFPSSTYTFQLYSINGDTQTTLSLTSAISTVTAAASLAQSERSGFWSDAAIWQQGIIPSEGYAAMINAGHTIILDQNATVASLNIQGTLRWSSVGSSSTLALHGGNLTIYSGGQIQIADETAPLAPGTTAAIILSSGTYLGQYGLTLYDGGALRIWGSTKSAYSTALSNIAPLSASLIVNVSSAAGWIPGDTIAVSQTEQSLQNQTESRVITSLSGSTLIVDQPFVFPHYASNTIIVANLTRNAVIRSSGSQTGYLRSLTTSATNFILNHAQLMDLGSGDLSGLRLEPSNGRTAAGTIEYSAIGPGAGGVSLSSAASIIIKGNVIYNQYGSGLRLTGSSNATIISNAIFNNQGYGLWLSSSSMMNTLRNNNISANAACGLLLTRSSTNTIETNSIDANSGCGIETSTDTFNNSLSNNIIFNNRDAGIRLHGARHSVSANQIHDNGSSGLFASGQYFVISQNQIDNNRSHGLLLNGNANVAHANLLRGNSASGIQAANGNNFFLNNISSGNAAYGILLNNASNSQIFDTTSSANAQGGISLDSSENLFFLKGAVFNNGGPGLAILKSTVAASDMTLGYQTSGAPAANTGAEIIFLDHGHVTLNNSRINPTTGISTSSLSGDFRSLISLKHNQEPGRVELWGDYRVLNSTLALDYSAALYPSTATSAQITPRQEASPLTISVSSTTDNYALTEHINITYNETNQQWLITGSASGTLGNFSGSLTAQPFPNSATPRFYLNATAHSAPAALDRADLLTRASSHDESTRKRLIFNATAPGFNSGKSRLMIGPGGGFVAKGAPWSYASIEAAPGALYYTIISSGAFTLLYSSVTNMDESGLQLGGSSATISMSSSTFDYLANAATSAFITARDLTSTAIFSFVRFDNSGSTTAVSNAYNVRVIGSDANLNWFFGASTGALSGINHSLSPGDKIIWNSIASPPTISAITINVSSITWGWSPAIGATGYRIISSTQGNLSGNLAQSSSSWTETGLSTNTLYSRRLVAFNFLDQSTSAASALYTLAAPPKNVRAADIFFSSASLIWEANSNSSSTVYQLSYWGAQGSTQTTSVNTATASLADLVEGSTYSVLVAAQNSDGRSNPAENGIVSFVLYLNNPAFLAATALGISSISWRWTDIGGEDGYRVISSSGGNMSGALSAGSTQWTESGLSTNTSYSRRILAFKETQTSSSPLIAVYTMAADPSNLQSVYTGVSSMTVSWIKNGNPEGTLTRLLTWTASGATTTVSTALSSNTLTDLLAGVTYYFSAVSLNGDNLLSGYSAIFSAYTQNAIKNSLIDRSRSWLIVSPRGRVRVNIPAGAFPDGTNITINEDISSNDIILPSDDSLELSTSSVVEITATLNNERVSPAETVLIEIRYSLTDFASGSKIEELFVGRFDNSHQEWTALESSRDSLEETATGLTRNFSLFGLLRRAPAANVHRGKAYPNPFTPSKGHQKIYIDNIPARSSVSIYAINGILVRHLTDDDGDGRVSWDVTNDAGNPMASGLYLGQINNLGQSTLLKIAVER